MTDPDANAPASQSLGWMIPAMGVAQICSWGSIFYSFPLIAEAMRVDLGWDKPALYLAATLGVLCAAACAYPVGAAIDRGFGRYVMGGASVLAGLLFFAWSQVTSIAVFYAVFAVLGALQAALLYDPAFAVIARRVGAANARRSITALTLWGGFASTVFVPLDQLLIDQFGWRGALMVLGGINILVCGGIYSTIIDPARDRAPPARSVTDTPPLAGLAAVAWAFRRPAFWMLMLAYVSYAAAYFALTFHLYPLLLERGLDAASVVIVMAVFGPSQVAGRVLIWTFAPNIPVRILGSIVVPAFPLALAGFAFAPPDLLVLAAVSAVLGAANGMITIVRGLAVPEMVSRDAYGAINGALIAPMNVMQALAPLAAAWAWSATGGYDAVLTAMLGASFLLVISFWVAAAVSRP
ncbi:MFS transporter [Aquibium oceanicum]|uniref:MFS transporter n=1 Tax=Aquibium oceanicum TaxID=1670800 RepID=UPI001F204BA9|nr:MFS transporter [Aquibium oceanicum]